MIYLMFKLYIVNKRKRFGNNNFRRDNKNILNINLIGTISLTFVNDRDISYRELKL